MGSWELFGIAVSLAMDAFAVSICKGLATGRVSMKQAGICGLWFGGFQALMPFIGWLLGSRFYQLISSVDHWIAFILLFLIGANMLRESFGKEEADKSLTDFSCKVMFPLAIATSIDALAVGITFALFVRNILPVLVLIGVTTFIISFAGVRLGSFLGLRIKTLAERLGGVVLILIGVKILVEHLGLLG